MEYDFPQFKNQNEPDSPLSDESNNDNNNFILKNSIKNSKNKPNYTNTNNKNNTNNNNENLIDPNYQKINL